MAESLVSIKWQETVDLAVTRLEGKTGLALAGLSPAEINFHVRQWTAAKTQGKHIDPIRAD